MSVVHRPAALLCAGLLALGVTACGAPVSEDPQPSPSGSAEKGPSKAADPTPPTRSGDDDRWNFDEAVQIEEPVYKALTTDSLLITLDGSALRMRDGAGEEVASTKPGKGRSFADVRMNGDQLVALEQDLTEPVPELTVSEVDPATGETGASASWTLSGFHDGLSAGRLRGQLGDLTIVEVAAKKPSTAHAVYAVDLAAGELAWSLPDASVIGVAPEVVLTSSYEGRRPAVVAVGADGSPSWTALQGGESPFLVGFTDGDALIGHTDDGTTTLSTLSLADGRQAARAIEADAKQYGCTPQTDDIAVCSLPNGDVLAWDLAGREELWRLPTDDAPTIVVRLVADGLVYGNLAGGGWKAVDLRTGEEKLRGGGSAPLALNADGAYFNDGAGRQWARTAG